MTRRDQTLIEACRDEVACAVSAVFPGRHFDPQAIARVGLEPDTAMRAGIAASEAKGRWRAAERHLAAGRTEQAIREAFLAGRACTEVWRRLHAQSTAWGDKHYDNLQGKPPIFTPEQARELGAYGVQRMKHYRGKRMEYLRGKHDRNARTYHDWYACAYKDMAGYAREHFAVRKGSSRTLRRLVDEYCEEKGIPNPRKGSGGHS